MNKIAVLIPTYNEEKDIKKVISDFKKELPHADIYVYDNNSTDETVAIAKKAGAIVKYEYNQGKGNVVRRMFREIEADIYIMVDGDDTYPASQVHELIDPILNKKADMVVGDRLSNGSYKRENKKVLHSIGNNLVRNLINHLFNVNLKDIMSGYRVFNRIFVKNMPILSKEFEIETEMTLYALDKRFIIKEIPITYKDRQEDSKSKVNAVRDGMKILKKIFSMFKDYKPKRFFWSIAIIVAIIGLLIGIPVIVEFINTMYITKVPSAILATGIMIFSLVIAQCGVILDTIVKHHKENFEHQLLNYEEASKEKK